MSDIFSFFIIFFNTLNTLHQNNIKYLNKFIILILIKNKIYYHVASKKGLYF